MKTILVVDDEFGIVEGLVAVLEDEGFRAFSASHGREALDRLADVVPDLVVLDLMMPVLDGHATLAALREHPRHRETPVILISAAPYRRKLGERLTFLRKPFDAEALLTAIRKALG